MQGSRALIAVAALVTVVALFFILRDGDDDESATTASSNSSAQTTTAAETTEQTADQGNEQAEGQGNDDEAPNDGGEQVATIEVQSGEPVGGFQELSFTEGDQIRFKVESDVADEVHLHGYDVAMEVAAGGSVEFDLPATATGVFEVELEHRVVPIAEITVNPG